MTALLTELDSHLRRKQKRAAAAVAAGAALLATALIASRIANPDVACDGSAYAQVWSGVRQQQVAKAFADSRLAYAASTYAATAKQLDGYFARWQAGYRDACEATSVHRESSELALDLRMACLKDRLAEATALVDVFAHADSTVVEHAAHAVAALPAVSLCDDVAALGAPVRPSPDVADAAAALRLELAQVHALRSAGKLADAEALAEEAHEQARVVGFRPIQAEAAFALARVHADGHSFDDAIEPYEEAIAAADAGRDDRLRALATVQLISCIGMRPEHADDALAIGEQARRIIERLGGHDPLLADLLEGESLVLTKAERHREALARYQEAAAIRERSGVEASSSAAAATTSSCRLASIQERLGRFQEARASYDLCLARARERLGDQHPDLMESLVGSAILDLQQGDDASGEQRLRSALLIGGRALGEDHPPFAPLYNNLGHALREQGRSDEALQAYERALALHTRARGEESPSTGVFVLNLGLVAFDQHRFDDADAAFRRALALFASSSTTEAYRFFSGVAETHLGDSLLAQGKLREARRTYQQAIGHIEAAVGAEHPQLVVTLTGLGRSELALGRATTARGVLERAVALGEAADGSPFELAAARFALARAQVSSGLPEEPARELARAAHAALEHAGSTTRGTRDEIARWLAGP